MVDPNIFSLAMKASTRTEKDRREPVGLPTGTILEICPIPLLEVSAEKDKILEVRSVRTKTHNADKLHTPGTTP